jgi:hypothetical protein
MYTYAVKNIKPLPFEGILVYTSFYLTRIHYL